MNLLRSATFRFLQSRRTALLIVTVMVGLLGTVAQGQAFDPDRYYRQCLSFEQGGDYETARQSCLNALAADPGFDRARLALGRIELELGNLAAAQSELLQVQEALGGAEPALLLAQTYILDERYREAQSVLAQAELRTGTDGSLAARREGLQGQLASRQGRFEDARLHLREAVRLDPGNRGYRLELATLLLDLGDAPAASEQMQAYLAAAEGQGDAEASSLLGWSLWAQGELAQAARELERAVSLRSSRQGEAQARDLRALGLVYYGLGDWAAGGLAFREAARRANLFTVFFASNLAWLLLLLLLLALHLLGESWVGIRPQGDTTAGIRMWSSGHVYGVLFASLAVALPLAVTYGVVRHDNLLALLTPIQNSDTRAVLFLSFSLTAALAARRVVRRHDWKPGPALAGGSDRIFSGVVLGLLLLAATLAFLTYLPQRQWLGEYFLDLAHLTPAVAAAMVSIPLAEPFFRAFALPAFEVRYGTTLAIMLSAALWALVFATPVLLLLAIGLVLAFAYSRQRSGAMTLAAQFTLHIGLLLAVLMLPWARSLFV